MSTRTIETMRVGEIREELSHLRKWQRAVADGLGISEGPGEGYPWHCEENAADAGRHARKAADALREASEREGEAESLETLAQQLDDRAVEIARRAADNSGPDADWDIERAGNATYLASEVRDIAMRRQIVDAEVVDNRIAHLEEALRKTQEASLGAAARILELEEQLAERSEVAQKQRVRMDAAYGYLQGVQSTGEQIGQRAAEVAHNGLRILSEDGVVDAPVVDERVAELEKRLYDSVKLNLEQQALIDRTVEYLQRAQAGQFRHVGSALVAVNALERLSADGVVDEPVVDDRVAELERRVDGLGDVRTALVRRTHELAAQLADERRRNAEHLERINALTDTAGQAANHIASLKFELAERTAHLEKSEKCATKMAFRAETAQRRADDLSEKLDQAVRHNAEHLEAITALRESLNTANLKLGEHFGIAARLRRCLDLADENLLSHSEVIARMREILDGKP